jgi:DNA-binding response OmpR family regulator
MNSQIVIIDNHAMSRARIEEALHRHGIEGCHLRPDPDRQTDSIYIWIGNKDEKMPENFKVKESDRFLRPVRVGVILERVKRLKTMMKYQNNKPKFFIGSYILNSTNSELLSDDGLAIRLTDKEKEILLLLAEVKGATISRDILLEKVWAYAPNLETHTLETHIYRLRQKIEKDPAKPEILLTDGAGYKLLFKR